MKFTLLLIVALAGITFAWPPYAEGTGSLCAAFEHRAKRLATSQLEAQAKHDPSIRHLLSLVDGAAAKGLLAGPYLREHFPGVPPMLACTLAYWRSVANPDTMDMDLAR